MTSDRDEIKPPSKLLFLLEGRALGEMATTLLILPLLKNAPKGDGHPVLVLPGFMAGDLSTRPLRSFLRDLGYSAHRWDLGRNLGVSEELESAMLARLRELHQRHGRKVSLIGWSLGGVYARFLANRTPEHVRSVITLGSPFGGDLKANNSWKLYEWITGGPIEEIDRQRLDEVRKSPPVPTTSIYSRSDGITAWQCAIDEEGPLAENVQVRGSHLGLGFNPMVLHAIADRLAQPEGRWRPFELSGFRGVIYGESAGGTLAL